MAQQSSLKPVGKLFADSWRLYKKHMNVLALIAVIPLIFAGVKMVLQPSFISDYGFSLWVVLVLLIAAGIFGLLNIVFSLVMPIALAQAIDESHKGKTAETSAVYKIAFAELIQYLFILMLVVIIVLGGGILFIIPGIVASIYLKFAIFTYLFEDKRGMDALVTSAWYVRGSWWAILGRHILLAIVLFFAGFVFTLVIGSLSLMLGFGAGVFGMLLQLFTFMILVPYALVYLYLLYKDARSLKEGKTPDKDFVDESEKLFIILLIVAAVATLIFFFMATFSPWGLRIDGQTFGGSYYVDRGSMQASYSPQNIYRHHFEQYGSHSNSDY